MEFYLAELMDLYEVVKNWPQNYQPDQFEEFAEILDFGDVDRRFFWQRADWWCRVAFYRILDVPEFHDIGEIPKRELFTAWVESVEGWPKMVHYIRLVKKYGWSCYADWRCTPID